jgi:hypothetical protein
MKKKGDRHLLRFKVKGSRFKGEATTGSVRDSRVRSTIFTGSCGL